LDFFHIHQLVTVRTDTKRNKKKEKRNNQIDGVLVHIPSEKAAEEGRGGEGEKHESREVYE